LKSFEGIPLAELDLGVPGHAKNLSETVPIKQAGYMIELQVVHIPFDGKVFVQSKAKSAVCKILAVLCVDGPKGHYATSRFWQRDVHSRKMLGQDGVRIDGV
jgi:hypothetical protein